MNRKLLYIYDCSWNRTGRGIYVVSVRGVGIGRKEAFLRKGIKELRREQESKA